MIVLSLFIGLVVFVIFMSTVFNKDFIQGYRNSKFLDELMKEDQQTQDSDSKELTHE